MFTEVFATRRLRDEFARLLGELYTFPSPAQFLDFGPRCYPAVNLWEEPDSVIAESELAGVNMSDLTVTVRGDELSISGERKDEYPLDVIAHRRERTPGKFHRVVRLPVAIDADAVAATMKDGVLTIRMPKSPAVLPRKIEVKG